MRIISYCLLFGLFVLQACVEPFDPKLRFNERLLVVNATITDQAEPLPVILSQSTSRADSANLTTPLTRAAVTVLVDGTTTVTLRESPTDPGTYAFPAGFRGRVGSTYQLRFQTAEGIRYESSVETLMAAPPVTRAYDTYNPAGLRTTADAPPTPTNDVFIDFTDPAGQRNFYLWRWRLYEVQSWCATCIQGRYVIRDIGPVGSGPVEVLGCVVDPALPFGNKFDYPCRGQCWAIFYSSRIDIMADVYTNGAPQVGHKIASVPMYQREPALLTIEQLAISANAYRYYRIIADQSQNTGTLADAPPAPLAGNVRNLADPAENVVGYFTAAGVAVYHHKLNRRNLPGDLKGLFFEQNRREPNIDLNPNALFPGQGLPSALCTESRTQTPTIPPGWNQ